MWTCGHVHLPPVWRATARTCGGTLCKRMEGLRTMLQLTLGARAAVRLCTGAVYSSDSSSANSSDKLNESTEVSAVPAEVVDAKTSVEGSPVAAHIFISQAGPMDQLTVSGIMMLGSSRALWRHTYFYFIATSNVLHHAVHITRSTRLVIATATQQWTHIAPVSTQHAPVTGTSTYARKSWGGHPQCDLAPLTTSHSGPVGQWERQHLAHGCYRHTP